MNHSEPAASIRPARARRVAKGRESLATVRVTVSWTSKNRDGGSPLLPTEFELTRELAVAQNQAWTCANDFEFKWLEALFAAHCHEVVLTTRLGDNFSAKHLVLELAERLTLELAAHQPLIRVLFLPSTSAPRGVRNHA